MKLKYTLVFTIISFFITTVGFTQTYSDQEIGLNVDKITASLKKRGVTEADIDFEISLLRRMHTSQYVKIKQKDSEILKETKAKAFTNKSALAADISTTEKAALQALYNSTNGVNWVNKQGWDFSTPVTSWDGTNGWYGITVTNGTVTDINLGQNNLVGTLPSEIGNLPGLQLLYLQANELSGTIPNEIGALQSLKTLWLSNNQLIGSIPSQIGNLLNLNYLALDFNQLTGSIPTTIGNPRELIYLSFANNQLTGSIPGVIGNLSKVESLYLYHNQLSGAIPVEIGNLASVDALFLEFNKLSGSIPNEISKLSKLEFFNLSNNELTGLIPTGIGNLYYNLQEVYFQKNQLSGPIPTEILLYNLASLYLDHNQLSGPVPSNINRLRNVGLLYLNHNQLTGTIPTTIGTLPEAIHVNLSNNQLTGTIPVEIGGLAKIQMLDLSFNQLTGSLPSEIGNLTYIRSLFLNNNEFSGTIPSRISQLTFVGNIYINNNKFRFLDFANEFESYKNFYGFRYVDQAKIDTKEILKATSGGSVTLTMCTDNRYTSADTFQWYKGQYPNGDLITNATNRQYTISNLTLSNSGDYYCLSSHPQITILTNPNQNLVLERQPITLDVSCDSNVSGNIIPDSNEFILNTNSNINFSFNTSFTNLIYDWTFYNLDGTISSIATTNTANKLYTAAGSYKVSLIITDQNGCKARFEKTITMKCPILNGVITTSTPDVFVGRSTNFSLETTATDLSYKWTFTQDGESTIFTTKTVDYTYIRPGTNNVTLEVTDSNGCKSTFQKLVSLKTGSTLCNDVTQFGRAFVQVGSDTDLYKAATVSVNQTTNVTFSSQNYGPGADFEYKWSLLNENNQLVDSGTNLNFPITPTIGGLYTLVLDLKENTTGCTHQFTRAIVSTIPNSCAQTNPQSANVKGLVINLLKDLISRAMKGESDVQINSSAVTAEFNALKPYITSGQKDKIYNFSSTRNLYGEFTGIDLSFSPDRASDIHISIPHSLRYEQTSTNEEFLSLIESKIYINLSQYTSANQYLISCFSQSTGKSLLKPNDCQYGSEIRYIDFCPNECDPLLGVVKVSTENPTLNTAINFSLETAATGLTYNWTFYNADNTVKGNQTSSIGSQTYTAAGNYKVVLVATDSNNCSTTITKTININSCIPLSGTIKTAAESINEYSTTNFYFDTTATGLTYEWTFYRNMNSSVAPYYTNSVNHYYDVPGTYNIKLVVTDSNGCKTTFRKTVVVTKPVCIEVNGTITSASNNVFVDKYTEFYLQTNAANLEYSWAFYNLSNTSYTTYTTPRVYHPYYVAGNYNVILTVREQNGCQTTFNKIVTVKVQPPCVNVVGEIKVPNGLISTNVNNAFTFETQATNISYQWTFYNVGGLTTLSNQSISNPSQIYTNPGEYLIVLITKDQNDCTTTFRKYITVSKACTSITGSISIPTETISTNQNIPFTFNTTASGISYQWTFYNLDNSTRAIERTSTVNKSYTSPGDYLVNLEITGQDGCKISFDKTIHVTGECAIYGKINVNTENPTLFTTATFAFETSATDLIYNWTVKIPENSTGYYNYETGGNPFNLYLQYGEGDYKIMLEVKDSNGCSKKFEKTINVQYDCSRNAGYITGQIYNNSHKYYTSSNVLINAPNKFTFWSNNSNNENLPVNWELTDLNGSPISSGTENEFIFTPTTSNGLILTLTITDQYGCPHHFSKELNVVSLCQYNQDDIDGAINFDEEYSYKVAFIDANQTKDLIFRSYDENNTKVYTYNWNLYDLDGSLLSSGNQQKFPITLSNAGFYKVTLDLIDPDTGCPIQFTTKIGCVIYNSCTENSPKSQIVKDLFLNLIRSLIIRSSIGETDEQINNSEATPEFIALKPYITNGPKDKIYNFKSKLGGENGSSFEGFEFSFSPERQSDVYYHTRWAIYFDPWDIENSTDRINQTLYLALSQYVSADQSLVSCYVDYGGKMAGKNVNRLEEEDCTHQLAVQYIDFCPAEDCTPITGTLKSTSVLGAQTGDKKIQLKPASRK